jgi:hypothetical protein
MVKKKLKPKIKMMIQELVQFMHMACSKINDADESIRYFCGMCWTKIRANE